MRINEMLNMDEVLRKLSTPHRTVFNLTDNRDYTSYYRQKRSFFPKICPVCHKYDNNFPIKVIKVFSLTSGRWKPYVTPVCKECVEKYIEGQDMNYVKEFFVQRFFLCSCPYSE